MGISRMSGMDLWKLPDCMGLSDGGKCIWLVTESIKDRRCEKENVSDW